MKSTLLVTTVLAAWAIPAIAQNSAPAPAPDPMKPSASVAPDATKRNSFGTTQGAGEMRTSKLVGLNVRNSRNEKIGDINELILDTSGKVVSAVIGVGGFLGIGEKNVAVAFSDLIFTRKTDGALDVTFESTKEVLQSAPNYTYYQQQKS